MRSKIRGASLARTSIGISVLVLLLAFGGMFWVSRWPDKASRVFWLAICGAFLSVAAIGLLYEVFIRAHAEEATIKKMRLAASVFQSGLQSVQDSIPTDWLHNFQVTDSVSICALDLDPYIFTFGDAILDRAEKGSVKSCGLVHTGSQGSYVPTFAYLEFARKWEARAPNSKLTLQCAPDLRFDVIVSGSKVLLGLPPVTGSSNVSSRKFMEFELGSDGSVGRWLSQQLEDLVKDSGTYVDGRGRQSATTPSATQPSPLDKSGSKTPGQERTLESAVAEESF
jgi:hypothetical protein